MCVCVCVWSIERQKAVFHNYYNSLLVSYFFPNCIATNSSFFSHVRSSRPRVLVKGFRFKHELTASESERLNSLEEGILERDKAAEIQSWNIHTWSCFTALLVGKIGLRGVKNETNADGAPDFPVKRDGCIWGRASAFPNASVNWAGGLLSAPGERRERERKALLRWASSPSSSHHQQHRQY